MAPHCQGELVHDERQVVGRAGRTFGVGALGQAAFGGVRLPTNSPFVRSEYRLKSAKKTFVE